MKRIGISILAFAVLIAGCGDRTDEHVYDTENNPHGFPNRAVALLEQIETGRLATFDMITEGFDDLYTNHTELLDNEHWREVIKRLGRRFESRADEFVGRGIEYYSQAAGFYTLAAFAQPNNEALTHKSRLFEGWTAALRRVGSDQFGQGQPRTLTIMTRITRELMFGDSLQQEFARQYVIDGYLQPLVRDSGAAHLPTADQALLEWMGLAKLTRYDPQVEFAEPPLHLVTARTAPARLNLRLELYFKATDSVDADWRLALNGSDPDTDTVIIEPHPPTSEWRPDEVQIVTRMIDSIDPDSGLRLGLFLLEDGEHRWSDADGNAGPVHIIDAPPAP